MFHVYYLLLGLIIPRIFLKILPTEKLTCLMITRVFVVAEKFYPVVNEFKIESREIDESDNMDRSL